MKTIADTGPVRYSKTFTTLSAAKSYLRGLGYVQFKPHDWRWNGVRATLASYGANEFVVDVGYP